MVKLNFAQALLLALLADMLCLGGFDALKCQPEKQWHYDQIVDETDDRNEVGNQVNWREQINYGQQHEYLCRFRRPFIKGQLLIVGGFFSDNFDDIQRFVLSV